MKTNNKDKMIEEAVEKIVSNAGDCVYGMNIDCSMQEAKRLHSELGTSPLLQKQITETLTTLLTKHEEAVVERHAKEINRILNLHSKPIAEGGLDYVKAFEEMERYEKKLYKKALTPDNSTSDNK